MKGLFVNSYKCICSIHEVGFMTFNVLQRSNKYTLDYIEGEVFGNKADAYDFIIVNYHFTTNKWMDANFVSRCKCPVIALVLEVGFDDPLSKTPKFFDHYLILDPSLNSYDNITILPRPLDTFPKSVILKEPTVVVGSFGFATDGKHWHKIVEQVNKDFDNAIIRFNIPFATFVPSNEARIRQIDRSCRALITKPGISFEITSHNFTRQELVDWCAENTINCFFYFRQGICPTGLAAVTDQAVSAGRPLLVTADKTFRHLHKYLPVYPDISIKDAIEKMERENLVEKIIKDWHPNKLIAIFENALVRSIKRKTKPPMFTL